jgi:uncharacterized protein DUF6134
MRPLTITTGLLLAASPLLAQGRMIDEGTLIVTKNGVPVGREVFRIVRAPSASGELYRATANISVGDQRITPALSADTSGTPVAYEVGIRAGTKAVLHIQALTRPARFAVREQTTSGEASREYVVPKRYTVLDEDIFHHYYFVSLAGVTGSVAVIDPQGHAQVTAALERVGVEQLDIGGKMLSATHYSLVAGSTRRDFWVDAEGRLLKVAVPDRGLLAVRDEPPR